MIVGILRICLRGVPSTMSAIRASRSAMQASRIATAGHCEAKTTSDRRAGRAGYWSHPATSTKRNIGMAAFACSMSFLVAGAFPKLSVFAEPSE